MAASTLHIVFDPSAAASLRDALRQAGRDERVVSLSDCLSFGPINPPDPGLRTQLDPKMHHCVSLVKVTLCLRRSHTLIHSCCRAQRLNGKRRRGSLERRCQISCRPQCYKPEIWSRARVPAHLLVLAAWNFGETCLISMTASCSCRPIGLPENRELTSLMDHKRRRTPRYALAHARL